MDESEVHVTALRRPSWADVQDQRSDFQTLIARDMHESDRMDLDETPIPPPPVRCLPRRIGPLQRLWRRAQIAWFLYCERCSREERDSYAARGVPLGKAYLRNCLEYERDMRSKAALLSIDC